jgi:hypothetical protein
MSDFDTPKVEDLTINLAKLFVRDCLKEPELEPMQIIEFGKALQGRDRNFIEL